MPGPLLEVIAGSAADARAARDGGADRIELVSRLDADGLTPDWGTVSEVLATGVPARVMIRPADVFTVSGPARESVVQQARSLGASAAASFVVGYVDGCGELDLPLLKEIAKIVARPVTLHRAFDRVRDAKVAYDGISGLPGFDTILTGGGADGLGSGGVGALASWAGWPAGGGPAFLAGGGLEPGHVPTLWAAGIRQFHVGTAARPSRLGPVEAPRVRVIRDLIDALAGS
ncbi:MAG: copper homeostasis protein CutC [Mycobacteriales bacterium]